MLGGKRTRVLVAAAVIGAGAPLLGLTSSPGVDLAESAGYLRSTDGGDTFRSGQLDDVNLGVNIVHAVARQGQVHALFSNKTSDESVPAVGPAGVYYRRSDDGGGSFSSSVQLDDDEGNASESDLAVAGQVIHVAWEEHRLGEELEEIFYTRSTDGGATFEPPRNLTATAGIEEHDPDLAVAGDLVVLVWEGTDEDDPDEDPDGTAEDDTLTEAHDVFVMVSTDGGQTFSDELNLTNTGDPSPNTDVIDEEPAVALHGDTVVIAYRQREDENLRPEDQGDEGRTMVVRSTARGAPGTWSTPQPLPGIDGTNTPAVHIDGAAVHVFACHEDDPGDPNDLAESVLAHWRSGDGAARFAEPAVLSRGEPCSKVDVDGVGGDLHVVYEQDVADKSDTFYLRSRDGGATFEPGRPLTDNPFGSEDPSVSVDPADAARVHITWTDSSDFLLALRDPATLPTAGGDAQFTAADVIRFRGASYELVIDGTPLGLDGLHIDGLAQIPWQEPPPVGDVPLPEFVLSFAEPADLPDVGPVAPSDLVLFSPTALGADTAGRFRAFLRGADIGLDQAGENIDAVDIDEKDLYLSTTGPFDLDGELQGEGDDVFVCRGASASSGESRCEATEVAFDASDRAVSSPNGATAAFAFSAGGNGPDERAFFTAAGDYRAGEASGGPADVFSCLFPEFDDDVDPEPTAENFDGDLADCGGPHSPLRTVFRGRRHALSSPIAALAFPSRELADERPE